MAQYLTNASAEADGAAILSVYVLDRAVAPDSKNPVQYYINIDAKVQITRVFGGAAIIEFAAFEVETDVNIWPI